MNHSTGRVRRCSTSPAMTSGQTPSAVSSRRDAAIETAACPVSAQPGVSRPIRNRAPQTASTAPESQVSARWSLRARTSPQATSAVASCPAGGASGAGASSQIARIAARPVATRDPGQRDASGPHEPQEVPEDHRGRAREEHEHQPESERDQRDQARGHEAERARDDLNHRAAAGAGRASPRAGDSLR